MAVERKGLPYFRLFHQEKGDAIGEADFLIGVFREELYGLALLLAFGSQDLDHLGIQDIARAFGREAVGRSPREQGEELIQDEIARVEALSRSLKFFPCGRRGGVVLIFFNIPGKKGARVDVDHSLSP